MTNRERMAMHATNKTCAGCHNLVDPIGYGFEKFDAIGQRREKLKLTFGQSFGESKQACAQAFHRRTRSRHEGLVAGIPNSVSHRLGGLAPFWQRAPSARSAS